LRRAHSAILDFAKPDAAHPQIAVGTQHGGRRNDFNADPPRGLRQRTGRRRPYIGHGGDDYTDGVQIQCRLIGGIGSGDDAFGNQITAGDHSYTLDAVGRNITDSDAADQTNRTFQYSGADNTIASDGNYTYSYDPSGGLTGVNAGSSPGSGLLAITDAHDDVIGTFASGATSLSGSATYDPLGNVTATGGVMGRLGYQSGWAGVSLTYRYLSFEQGGGTVVKHLSLGGPMLMVSFTF